jgi:hypothetical protein
LLVTPIVLLLEADAATERVVGFTSSVGAMAAVTVKLTVKLFGVISLPLTVIVAV